MNKIKYLKISKNIKIRYLTNNLKKNINIVFLHGFMSDIDGEKPMPTKRPLPKRDHTPETSDAPEKDEEIDAEESDSQETEPDIVTLRERKLAKLHQQEQQDNPEDEQGDLTEISIDEIEV